MAKRRMNKSMVATLHSHVDKVVDPVKERIALEKAYAKAMPLVLKLVHGSYPPNEMAICKKWNVGRYDKCIKIQLADNDVKEFTFDSNDAPIVPTAYGCSNRMYIADDKTSKAVVAWAGAFAAHKQAKADRVMAYRAVINQANYVEDLHDIWPEAEALLPARNQIAVALAPEHLVLVKVDIKERAKQIAAA